MRKCEFCGRELVVNNGYSNNNSGTIDKLVPEKNSYVVFDGKKFYLLPSCGKLRFYEKGLSSFFPTKITAYEFRWNSPYPVDPNTGEPVMLSPDVEKALDQEGALRDYAGSQQAALSSKGLKLGGMEKFMPIILIVLAIAVGYLVYTNFQAGKNDKVTQQAIIDIYNTFNQMAQPIIPGK